MKNKTLWIVLGAVAVVLLYVGMVYNGLVSKNEAVNTQWAQVETQYQRRLDLIPNLVATVKGAMQQEVKVFGDLANARANYAGARSVDEKVQAASQVEGALGRLLVVMENYPQLTATNSTTNNLMAELTGTENRVSVERMRFNDAVKVINMATKQFPSSIVAALFGFKERPYFEAASGAEVAPKVQF